MVSGLVFISPLLCCVEVAFRWHCDWCFCPPGCCKLFELFLEEEEDALALVLAAAVLVVFENAFCTSNRRGVNDFVSDFVDRLELSEFDRR